MKTFILLLTLVSFPVAAQWLNYPDPRTPRNEDGSPDLSAPAPTLGDTPDLSGVWQMKRAPLDAWERILGEGAGNIQTDLADISIYAANVFGAVPPFQAPMTPAGVEVFRPRLEDPHTVQSLCLPSSVPLSLFTLAFKIVQAPQELIVLTEYSDPARQIYTDGRELPKDPTPAWIGYSVGSWDDDTLVVETTGFTSRAWLDLMGHPRSESMHITERYHRRDFGHMDVEITFNDPVNYTEPFTLATTATLIPDSDILEFVCNENERDREHMQN